jgi:hypothetical protein
LSSFLRHAPTAVEFALWMLLNRETTEAANRQAALSPELIAFGA